MIIAKEGEKRMSYLIPSGTYHGVCYAVWDIGLQETTYKDEKKVQHKVIIAWELNDTIPDGEYKGKRACINKRYTLSLDEKATLRKDLQNWRGKAFTPEELKGFDIEKLIGANCMISVVHNESNGKTYANIGSISKPMNGLAKMIPENKSDVPEWVKKIQEKAIVEWSGNEPVEVSEENEPEIAF